MILLSTSDWQGGCDSTIISMSFKTRRFCRSTITYTRRKTEINDSINDSFLSRLGLNLPINNSNNVFGFESLSMSRLCHLSRLCTRG
jgi:hypothetical protein